MCPCDKYVSDYSIYQYNVHCTCMDHILAHSGNMNWILASINHTVVQHTRQCEATPPVLRKPYPKVAPIFKTGLNHGNYALYVCVLCGCTCIHIYIQTHALSMICHVHTICIYTFADH